MRAHYLWTLSMACLAVGTWAIAQPRPQPRLGQPMDAGDVFENRMTSLGRSMFAIPWPADKGKKFNALRCTDCHSSPVIGGEAKDPKLNPIFGGHGTSPENQRRFLKTEDGNKELEVAGVPRRSPPLFGIGLLAEVPDATLLSLSDPTDKDDDGISGRLIKVHGGYGRFGWKSHLHSLEEFVNEAFLVELGAAPHDSETNPDALVDANQINAAFRYLRHLAPPAPLQTIDQFPRGPEMFANLDCAKCHTPELKTQKGEFAALSEQVIRAYTDLLLHDMGDGELHSAPAAPAKREVRTPPLWGLGRMKGPFLHDASAATIQDAILGHGGEGKASAEKFSRLSSEDKDHFLGWLKSL